MYRSALVVATLIAAPAAAQTAASPADAQAAGAFVGDLSNRAFAVLRDRSISREAAKQKFRGMLRDNFDIAGIGNRLIRRYRAQATPAQLAAYQAALPDFVVNTYTDRLYDFSNAEVKVVRTAPRGTTGGIDVYSQVRQGNANPFEAIWAVKKDGGRFLITNFTVSGINLAVTQEADFSAYIQKNGFDALVNFMRNAGRGA